MKAPEDGRAAAALLTMQRNREQLLATYAPPVAMNQFPRSATFRWVTSHLTGKAVAATLVSAALSRPAWLRVLGLVLSRRRRR